MYDFLSIVINAFGILGIIMSIISIFVMGRDLIITNIISNSFLIIFFILLSTQIILQKKSQLTEILKSIISVFLTIIFLLYSLFLKISYQERISKNNVYTGYRLINNASTFLLIIQMFVFYGATQTNEFKTTHLIPNYYNLFLVILSLINIVLISVLGIMLKYFYTDG
jgi:hypothetical protein